MYICIDVGGTKTLIASFSDNGEIVEQSKIPTPPDYQEFLKEVEKVIKGFTGADYKAGSIGVPAVEMDRDKGIAIKFGNLGWQNVNIVKDIEAIVNCPIYMENDAKLAGLSEAVLLNGRFDKIMYITVSTGIGIAVIDHLQIDIIEADGGGRVFPVPHEGKYVPWESFASGHAIVERYGKMAKDIDDEDTWKKISHDLAEGLIQLVAVFMPEVVVVGGAVGEYFDKFGKLLKAELGSYQLPLIDMPEIIGAKRPNEAVIYGCFDYVKQKLNNE